ncbi:hypothetical protein LOK49_LG03G03838 [Camellia lanceoleosa]|uniref:Uncharacterized protein n=1 Tax=Camellia lanceoleosa TaxID=1840588 RepID=A0ACC0IEV3_9ERIC|nr:hypothetical protein LOK49_LG03G03838 [Camellia lanceoleosa]
MPSLHTDSSSVLDTGQLGRPFHRCPHEGHSHQAQVRCRMCLRFHRHLQPRICSKDVFHIIRGNTSMSLERLDVGALVSHAFELESEVQALFYGALAVITFCIPIKAALQKAYSTPILPLDILADKPPVKKFEWDKLGVHMPEVSELMSYMLQME